jgi:hypothetical protein
MVAALVALPVGLVLASPQADAQVVKPFKITGSGVGPQGLPLPGQDPRPHSIVGEATHLGHHTGLGTVETLTVDVFDLTDGIISGKFCSGEPFVFTGANGDELACDYGDHGNGERGDYVLTILDFLGFYEDGFPILLVQALWTADFVAKPDMSTGKFAGVTGSWVMVARSEPFVLRSDDPVYYSWSGDGSLTFGRGN